jgi:ribosomal protein L11 methyltransferase
VVVPAGVELETQEIVPDADWLAVYRDRARPFPVGRSFFVDPREPGEEPVEIPAGRRLLRLPARAAFGTGSHESTALALELLEDVEVRGRRVLDVGTGTGVLAFAALLCGARSVMGLDLDVASPFHARDNSTLNGLHPRCFAGRLAAIRERPLFDLALVNVVPEQILPEMPDLVRRLRPGAEAILSGILAERGREVVDRLRGLGLAERDRREAGEWAAFRVGMEGP